MASKGATKVPKLTMFLVHHRGRSGSRMTAENRQWIKGYLSDECPERTTIKGTQIGFSEMLIAELIDETARGWSCLYVLPTDSMAATFVQNRIDPVIAISPHYRKLLRVGRHNRLSSKSADSVRMKELGSGVLKIVGSNSPGNFAEFPADRLYIDEYDLCDPINLAQAPQRLHASLDPRIRRISKPSVSDFGIDAEYNKSDQRQWFIPCGHCGEWQAVTWWDNVVIKEESNKYVLRDRKWSSECEQDPAILCRHCGARLNLNECNYHGEWVAAYPGVKNHHGYRINHIGLTATRILWEEFTDAESNETKMQEFYNGRLGEAYAPPGSALTDADLDACRRDYAMPASCKHSTTAGIDVGGVLHVRISQINEKEERKAVCITTVPDFESAAALLRRYNVERCVVDARPEIHKAREFQDAFRREVLLCEFTTSENIRGAQVDWKKGIVKGDRTEIIDSATADIRTGGMLLPQDARTLDGGDYYKQMKAPKRIRELDARGNPRFVWREDGKPDHHRLADCYDWLAARVLMPKYRGGQK